MPAPDVCVDHDRPNCRECAQAKRFITKIDAIKLTERKRGVALRFIEERGLTAEFESWFERRGQ